MITNNLTKKKKKQQIKIKFRDKLFSLSKKNGGMMNILLKQI